MEILADEISGHPLITRALSAYWRRTAPRERWMPPAPSAAALVEHNGRQYVILRSDRQLLRVYRVRAYDGILHRLVRWPAALDQEPPAASSDLYSGLFGTGRR